MSQIRKRVSRRPAAWVEQYRPKNLWQKLIAAGMAVVLLSVLVMYTIAQWYIFTERHRPLEMGVTFIPSYAEYLGLDGKETLDALVNDLGVKHFRLVSYWNEIEPTPGHYDFSGLDWQFQKVYAAGGDVSLAIGLRQPRWPECHVPEWATGWSKDQWYPALKNFMQAVIDHYKQNPALKSYQLENEYFLKVFGMCTDFSRDRLIDEYKLVKSLDSTHPTIVSRSNNWVGLPIGQPRPDEFGISVYKRVWDSVFTHRYVEYPYPAWYYAFYAGAGKILTGKDLIIHELQAEAWMPDGYPINDPATIKEQTKSLDAKRLKDRFEYGRATGMRDINLWGAEWWYWRKVKAHDSSLWDVAKKEFTKSN
ncbi:MAG TPA: beta-galactosidase [Patescibacteria group bacterium]|nr:beta-galactosidase [Patescibacteria group bacterium]